MIPLRSVPLIKGESSAFRVWVTFCFETDAVEISPFLGGGGYPKIPLAYHGRAFRIGLYRISGSGRILTKNRISGIRLAKIRPDPDIGINFIENRQINSLFVLFKSKISFFSIQKKLEILTTKKTNYLTFMLSKKLRVCKFQFFFLFYSKKYFFTTGYPDPAFLTTI